MRNFFLLLSLILIFSSSCRNPCRDVVCLNGGACSDGTCICPQGYTGTNCEQLEDPCLNINCQNGGNCVDGICQCPPGYSGTNCELQVDPCAGVNCQNGGVCVNGTCNCPTGYSGTFCETVLTPTALRVTKVRLDGFPAAAPDGTSWDVVISSFPDIFVAINIGQSANTNEFTTSRIEECIPGNSYVFTSGFPYTINTINTDYSFSIWDYDATSADDFMGGYYINLLSQSNGFPSTIRLYNPNASVIDMTLDVEWIF